MPEPVQARVQRLGADRPLDAREQPDRQRRRLALGAAQAEVADMHLETPLADLPGLHHHLALLGLAPERGKQHVERVGGEVTQRVLQAVLGAADAGEGFLQLALVLQQHIDVQPSGLFPAYQVARIAGSRPAGATHSPCTTQSIRWDSNRAARCCETETASMGCPCMVEGAPPRRCPESPARPGETRHRVAQIGTRGATSRSAPAQVAARQPTRLAGSTPPVETQP